MDKPLGPRLPDKRNEAYESIFGRSSTMHHQNGQLQPNSHFNGHIQYHSNLERRPSYSPSFPPSQFPQQSSSQYPSSSTQQYHYPQQTYLHNQPPPPPSHSRTVTSAPNLAVIINPHSDGPPDPAFVRSSLPSSHAYQTHVYPTALPPEQVTRYNQSDARPSPDRESYVQPRNGKAPDLPRLGLKIDRDDGSLGIDFAGGSNGSGSDHGTDDGSSELPWARNDHTPASAQTTTSDAPLSTLPGNSGARRFSSPSDQSSPHHSSRPYASQLDTDLQSTRLSLTNRSPSSPTLNDTATSAVSSSTRHSSDSVRTMPSKGSGARRERGVQDRSMSMSSTPMAVRTLLESPRLHEGRNSPNSGRAITTRRIPIVYPAMLSCVAKAFRDRIQIADRLKDGLTYKDAFDGREAVDKIAYIIKTTDRNLALLLGRALDAQKFFHDVTYDHRLRDSATELYQFRTKLPSPFVSGELQKEDGRNENGRSGKKPPVDLSSFNLRIGADTDIQDKDDKSLPPHTRPRKSSITSDEVPLPSGVFTLLTDCYSPTCSRDQLCYSIACPRRMEQQGRLNIKPQPGLRKQISRESLGDVVEPGTLWIHSVPQEIVNSVSDTEKKRQEAINEVIYTERDFVRDMEYLRDTWIGRLKDLDIIPQPRRTDFLEQVFWNIYDIIAVNTRLRDALNKRQKSYAVVERIGDILLDAVPHFGPFVTYGAHQMYGKYEFEKEKSSNPSFASFVEATERLAESRKLELNAYLTKPTTRLARYPLLLEAVLRHTPDDNPDKTTLPQVITMVREFLEKVNVETGKTENRFNLLELDQQIAFKPGEHVDLRLREEGRELIHRGSLNKRSSSNQGGDSGDLQVYLFDHALLMVKPQKTKHDQYRVYRRPIPLELLLVSATEDVASAARAQNRQKQSLVKRNSLNNNRAPIHMPNVPNRSDSKAQHSITFVHLGRKYYQITLWANTYFTQRKWVEQIAKQQEILRERSMIFYSITLSEGFFTGPSKVNCAAPFSFGRRVVYGTDDGVYLSDIRSAKKEPTKVLSLLEVTQVDVLEEYQLLIVLSERQVITFPLDALDHSDPMAGLKRAKRISTHTSFFKVGVCLGSVLVCIVKSSALSSTVKALLPIDPNERGMSKPTFRKLLQGGNDTLRPFREFYIPFESNSIHFLKTKLCVGCSKGFEIVDLENLDTQRLLDPADESLEFVRKRDVIRPMTIYRIDNEFLLCYDDFAFYVNKSGWRTRKEFMVHWEGSPTGFALSYPYVLAFEPTFIEIRHVETGLMSQVIQGKNLRLLFADTPPSTMNTASNMHYMPPVGGYGHNSYPTTRPPAGPQPNAYTGYVPPPGYGSQPPPQYAHYPQGVNRDEIIIVSDDRVLALRTNVGAPLPVSDNASMVSIPR